MCLWCRGAAMIYRQLLGLNRGELLLSMRSGEKGFPVGLGRWWSGSVEEHLWF